MTPEVEEALLKTLWLDESQGMTVYTILDAARDDRIYDAIAPLKRDGVCLYSGKAAEDLAKVAPYLVKLQKDAPFTESVLRDGWGNSWGIFFRSTAPMEELRTHFHKLLTVQDEDGNRIVFRYYDPRVFRTYLPTCDATELNSVFGPVSAFMTEARDATVLTEFRKESEELDTTNVSLLRAFSRKALEEDLTP